MARHQLPGVHPAGRGTSRLISGEGIYHIALVARLVQTLNIPLASASALAIKLLAAPSREPIVMFGELELRFARESFAASIDARIGEATESVVPPRRGRPPRRR